MQQLEKIISWADHNDSIRVMLLTGSRAGDGKKDEWSDYDIAVYGDNLDLIRDDRWLNGIADYWICIHDSFEFLGYTIPTRLIIFDKDFKVDFSFHPLRLFAELISKEKLADEYAAGYEILLDKDERTAKMQKPNDRAFMAVKPAKTDFQKNADEFWFEVYHVAKYLVRDDLWTAKCRDGSVKKWLRQMLEWNHGCQTNWDFKPKNQGKGMKDWLDEQLWNDLFPCFADFSKENSWRALENTVSLYRRIAKKTAACLNYEYDQKTDDKLSDFIKKLKQTL